MDTNQLFKELVWHNLVKAALGQLFAASPFLAWWPLSAIITGVVMKYADMLYDSVKLFLDVEYIAMRNETFHREFTVEVVKLKAIAKNKGINSKEYQDEREKSRQALSNFGRYNVAR